MGKKNKNAANLGWAIFITVIAVMVGIFIAGATASDAAEGLALIGVAIGSFNLVAIIYFGKTILDKLGR